MFWIVFGEYLYMLYIVCFLIRSFLSIRVWKEGFLFDLVGKVIEINKFNNVIIF